MDNFITVEDYDASIHREILDSLLRINTDNYDPQIIEICEDRAVSQMRSYMNKIYDCDAIFAARGDERHPLILMFALDIAIYHIFCQHNPYKMSAIRKERYDRAIEWLQSVMSGDVTIDGAPLLPDDVLADNSRWQIRSDDVRPVML
jgi:phage gp36-like protein